MTTDDIHQPSQTMPQSPRLSIRLGTLAEPLEIAAKAAGVSPGEYAKDALAERLGVQAESLPAGNPAIARLAGERHSKRELAEINRLWAKVPAAQQSNIVRSFVVGESAEITPAERLKQVVQAWPELHRNQQRDLADTVRSVAGVS